MTPFISGSVWSRALKRLGGRYAYYPPLWFATCGRDRCKIFVDRCVQWSNKIVGKYEMKLTGIWGSMSGPSTENRYDRLTIINRDYTIFGVCPANPSGYQVLHKSKQIVLQRSWSTRSLTTIPNCIHARRKRDPFAESDWDRSSILRLSIRSSTYHFSHSINSVEWLNSYVDRSSWRYGVVELRVWFAQLYLMGMKLFELSIGFHDRSFPMPSVTLNSGSLNKIRVISS